MEDAYVIGIRLALDNGVSAGVAAIHDDLVKLNRAIAESTANLRQLQAVAATTTAAALGQAPSPRPLEQKPQVPIETLAPPSPPQTIRHTIDAPQPAMLVSRMSETVPVHFQAPTPTEQTGSAPRSIPPSHAIPPMPIKIDPPSTETRIASPERVMVTAENPTQRSDHPAATPQLLTPPSSEVAAPQTTPLKVSAASNRQQDGAPTLHMPPTALSISVSAPPPHEAASGALQNPVQSFRETPSVPIPTSPITRPQAPPHPRLPSAPAKSIAAPMSSPSQTAASAVLPPAAPQSSSSPPGPTGGDVFLDGTRLGHWIATNLSRSAGRPPSGTTGFDPRLGVTWPGTQHGGG